MSSSKKTTVGYFYYKDLAGVLCHSPIDAITRIECSDRQIMRENVNESKALLIKAGNVFGGKDREGGIGGTMDIMFGDDNQTPNTYMQSKISTPVNAMRGVVSVVFNRLYMGMNPYMREFLFRVRKTNTGWYNEKAEIFPPPNLDSVAYDFSQLSWSMVGKNGAHGNSSEPVGNFGTTSFVIHSDNFSNDHIFDIDLAITASTEFREVIGGEQVGDYEWIHKGGVYASSNFNRYMIQISDPSETYYFNNGVSSDPYNDEERSAKITIQVKNGATVTCIADPVDNAMAKGVNLGYKQYVDFYATDATDRDINPAHIIRDCLTNKRYGKGAPDIKIDDVAFKNMADTLFNEGLGMSILWGGSSSIEDFITTVCDHICATIPYVDGESGLWTCKLLRDDYIVDDLLHLNESNIKKCLEFKRKTMVDLVNTVTVNYWDRGTGDTGTVTVDNPARIAQQGKVIAKQTDYDGFTNSEIASRVALRDLKTLSSPLSSARIEALSIASTLKVGDVFLWSWDDYGLDKAIMRVTSIKNSSFLTNYVTIECVEDSYSMPMQSVLPYVPPPESNFEDAKPVNGILVEAPYYELVQRYGQTFVDQQLTSENDSGYVLAVATTTQNVINADMLVSSGGEYSSVGAVDILEPSLLTQEITEIDSTINVSNTDPFDAIDVGSYFQINNELMSYLSKTGNVISVGRGVLDTIPSKHAVDSKIFMADEYSSIDETLYFDGQTIASKLLTNTGSSVLLESEAPIISTVMQSRAFRPYPPANVKINGEYYPSEIEGSLILTWVDRNRVQQTGGSILGWYEGGVTVESGVVYVVQVFDANDQLISTENLGAVNSCTVDYSSVTTEHFKIKLFSKRDSYASMQAFEIDILNTNYLSKPENITAEYADLYRPEQLTAEFDNA